MQFSDAIWWRHNKSKMADGRHIENRFLVISLRYIGRLMRYLDHRWRIIGRYRSRDQNGNFRKFKMADGRHFENSFISISQPWITDFDQIWYADANFHSEDGVLTKNRNFANSRWRTDAILKIVFGCISAPYWPINGNVDCRWRNTCIQITWPKRHGNFRKLKMADGRHFENNFMSISQMRIIRFRSNLVDRCKFQFREWSTDKQAIFCTFKMAVGRRTEYP